MDGADMNSVQWAESPGKISLEDQLTLLYYRLTDPHESTRLPGENETESLTDAYFRRLCRELDRVYGNEFVFRLREGTPGDDAARETAETALMDESTVVSLVELASAQWMTPDETCIACIRTSYEYGMEFLRAFNSIHEIIPDDSPNTEIAGSILGDESGGLIEEGDLSVLAASSASAHGEPGYVWHHKPIAGIESSLFRMGKDNYRFILHAAKGNTERRRIRITLKNRGETETVLDASYPKKGGSVILNYKGRIDEKTAITLKVDGIASEDG
jgi:hypothetical protein